MPPAHPLLLVCLGVLGLAAVATADAVWRPSTYPNPSTTAAACGHGPSSGPSLLCDPDGLLSSEELVKLEAALQMLEADPRGVQFAIALMKKFAPSTSAKSFAHALHDSWGVGTASKQDGVVLVLSQVRSATAGAVSGRLALASPPPPPLPPSPPSLQPHRRVRALIVDGVGPRPRQQWDVGPFLRGVAGVRAGVLRHVIVARPLTLPPPPPSWTAKCGFLPARG
jgi:hypothetical protein